MADPYLSRGCLWAIVPRVLSSLFHPDLFVQLAEFVALLVLLYHDLPEQTAAHPLQNGSFAQIFSNMHRLQARFAPVRGIAARDDRHRFLRRPARRRQALARSGNVEGAAAVINGAEKLIRLRELLSMRCMTRFFHLHSSC